MTQKEVYPVERKRIRKHQCQQEQQDHLADALDFGRADKLQKPVDRIRHQRNIEIVRDPECEHIAPRAFQDRHDKFHRHAPLKQ